MRTGLTYDDVLLVPKHGVLNKRIDADISSELVNGLKLEVPIVSANMPSVTGPKMARYIYAAGGYGILHRFNSIEDNLTNFLETYPLQAAGCSIGLNDIDRLHTLIGAGCKIFCLDVAHADHINVVKFVKEIKKDYKDYIKLIVGNVATYEGAKQFVQLGVEAIKVGIGPGAACRTREVTGFGVPQLTAIIEVNRALQEFWPKTKLIADGGIRNSGDIVKALAAGADTVMIGSLLAGCDEAPNPGEYYGNASEHVNSHRAPEGSYGTVKKTGPVEDVIKELAWGIRSGVSYGGATNLKELRENAEFILCTAAGQIESSVRI